MGGDKVINILLYMIVTRTAQHVGAAADRLDGDGVAPLADSLHRHQHQPRPLPRPGLRIRHLGPPLGRLRTKPSTEFNFRNEGVLDRTFDGRRSRWSVLSICSDESGTEFYFLFKFILKQEEK